jgi:hypothetical protein
MKKIYLLIALFAIFNHYTNAQVVYTNISDTTITRSTNSIGTSTFVFNLNADTSQDYNFAVRSQTVPDTSCGLNPPFQTVLSAYLNTMPGHSNQAGDSAGYAAFVDSGVLVDSAAFSWNVANFDYLTKHDFTINQCIWDSSVIGNWATPSIGYVALKFKVGTSIYYGWVHAGIEVFQDSTNNNIIRLTVYDYAYNSAAGQSIITGDDGTVGINNAINASGISVYPNPVNKVVNVSANGDFTFSLFGLNGEVIMSTAGKNISQFDLSAFPSGIYHYIIGYKDHSLKGKLILEK